MSHYLSQNIRFLRKGKSLTQEDLASKLGINRAALGSYEEGRAEPRLAVLQHIAEYFSCSLDDLMSKNLSLEKEDFATRKKGSGLRVLSVAVDKLTEKEKIVVVPVKAAAGYMDGFADVDFIESLPSFNLPLQELGKERSYRLFQIKGESMKPLPDGSYIITEYVHDWNQVKDNQCYVLITQDDGVVYKRVINKLEENILILKSDNPEFKSYPVSIEQISEIWRAIGYISLQLPDSSETTLPASQIMQALINIQHDVELIKSKVK